MTDNTEKTDAQLAKEEADRLAGELMHARRKASDDLLNSISMKTEAEYILEGKMEKPEDADPGDEHEDEESTNADPAGEHAEEEGDDGEDETSPNVDRKFKLKINGTVIEVSEAEMIRRAQESEGADAKFREAARLRQETEQLIQAQKPPAKADATAEVVEDDRALARALQMGTEEEAARVIAKLRPRLPTTDVAAPLIDERLAFREAATQIQSEHKELFADAELTKEFLALDQQFVNSGDKRPYLQRYRDLAEYILFRHGKQKAPVNSLADKAKRKATVTPIRPAASRSGEATEQEEDYDSFAHNSVSEVVTNGGHVRRR